MIKYIFILSTLLFTFVAHGQLNSNNRSVSQNTTFESGLSVEGRFDVTTTTIGSQPCPIMTSTQRDAIGSPATGDCVFNSTDAQYEFYSGSQWDSLGGAGTSATIDNILIKYNSSTGETVNSNIYSVGSLVGINQASAFGDLAVYDSGTDSVITLNNSVSGSTSSDGLVISQESNAASIQNKEADSLILGTNASDVLEIESDGTISAVSATYESLVTADDDIPNKKYVDDEITTSAATKQDLDGDLTAISALSSSGILARTGSETYSARTIQGTTDEITVTNGNGAGGDPTIGISNNPVLSGNEGVTIPNGTTAQRPVSPNTGELRWNTTDSAAEIYDGTDWSAVGGGLGSAQTISIVQSDSDAVDLSGSNSTFDGGGTISGTIAQNTTASNFLTGEKSVYFYDSSATPQNDYFGWTRNIPQGWRGRTIAYEFTYRTDSTYQNGDIVWQVKDNTNTTQLISNGNGLPLDQAASTDGNGQTIRGLVNVPVDAASLDFGFQVVGTTASFDFFVDKISLDIDDFNYKNVSEVNSVSLSGNDGRAITAGTESIPFNGTGTGWTSGADGSTTSNGNYYTVQNSDSVIQISGNVAFTGTVNNYIGMHLNGVFYKIVSAFNSTTRKKFQYTSKKGEFSSGDKIAFASVNSGGTLSNSTTLHYLNLVETKPNSKHVVVDSGDAETEYYEITQQNNFWDASGSIDRWDFSLASPSFTGSNFIKVADVGGDTTITALQDIHLSGSVQNYLLSAGAAVQVLNSSGSVIADQSGPAGYRVTTPFSVKLTQGDWIFFRATNSSTNRQGSLTLSVKKATQGEYHLVPVTDQENVFSARIANNGSASIISQSSNWIDNVTWNNTGNVTINYANLGLTVIPSFTLGGDVLTGDGSIYYENESVTSVTIRTADAGAPSNKNFDIKIQKQGSDYQEPRVFLGSVVFPQTCYLKDSKSANTNGGSSSVGTQTRTLNTKEGLCSWVTLGNGTTGVDGTANQFTLDAGKYNIECYAPAYKAGKSKAFIYDVDGTANILFGINNFTNSADDVITNSLVAGYIDISASNTYELDHYIDAARATNGLGGATNQGQETYSTCKITKVK